MARRSELRNWEAITEAWRWIAGGFAFSCFWLATSPQVGWAWLWAYLPVALVAGVRSTMLGFDFDDKGLVLHTMLTRRRIRWEELATIHAGRTTVVLVSHDGGLASELVDRGKGSPPADNPKVRVRAERIAEEALRRTGGHIPVSVASD